MARKNFIKKIIGSMLALSLVMSFCVIPHAAADAQNSTAGSDDIVYDIDFDRFTAAGGTVDGTKVCGGAYAVESVTQKDGTAGNALKIHLSDNNTRSIAFNDTEKWLKLNPGKYTVTYDYMLTDANNGGTDKTVVWFSKVKQKTDSFWSQGENGQYIGRDSVMVDGSAEKNLWHTGSVTVNLAGHTAGWFGLTARTKTVNIYIDNIKITRIPQPEIYNFDNHDFYDGIAQTDEANAIDGLDGTTVNNNDSFLPMEGQTDHNGNQLIAQNGGLFNVVNVENGKSRSYYLNNEAVAYNNADEYPGLAGTGHNNVLRMGGNGQSAYIPVGRTVALNNGSGAAKPKAGTYKLSLEYYVAGDAVEQKARLHAVYNVTSTIGNAGVYALGGDEDENVICSVFNSSTVKTGEWIKYDTVITLSENADNFGFMIAAKSGSGRVTEVFLDNVKLEALADPGENAWNFDYGVNAVGGSKKSGGTYVVGADTSVSTDDNKMLVIASGSQYNGAERAAMLLSNGEAKHLEKGTYKLSFKYAFKETERTFSGGKITFGSINDKDNFIGTTDGQLTKILSINESTLTDGKTAATWYDTEHYFDVTDENGIYFGISVEWLKNIWYLDDITLTPLGVAGDNVWNFDYGTNKGMTAVYDDSKKIGGSGLFLIGNSGDEQANVLKLSPNVSLYDGAERGIILNNGETPAEITMGKYYKLSFKYKYMASEVLLGKNWKNAVISFSAFKANELSSDYGAWNFHDNRMKTFSGDALIQDGAWHEYTSGEFYAAGTGNMLLGISAAYLRGEMFIDDIVVEEYNKFEIVSGTNFTVDGDYIVMNSASTYVSELKEGAKYGNMFVVTHGDTVIDGDVFVSTGDTVELKYVDIDNADNIISYDKKTVVVPYDVNCDGEADVRDLIRIKKLTSGTGEIENSALLEKAVGAELRASGVAAVRKALLNAPAVSHSVTVNGQSVNDYVIVNP